MERRNICSSLMSCCYCLIFWNCKFQCPAVLEANDHAEKKRKTTKHFIWKARCLSSRLSSHSQETLTSGVCLDIDDVTLGPVCTAFIRKGDQGLDKDGILGPGLETTHQPPRVVLWLGVVGPRRRVNIHHCPAVGAARILPIEFCHVLVRAFKTKQVKMVIILDYRSKDQRDVAGGSYLLQACTLFTKNLVPQRERTQKQSKRKGLLPLCLNFPVIIIVIMMMILSELVTRSHERMWADSSTHSPTHSKS